MMIALTPRIPICRTAQYFNPHFREGSDGQEYTVKGILMLFQSTLPQGKWLVSSWWFGSLFRFQSTLPQGKWPKAGDIPSYAYQFQSTLPQGKWHRTGNQGDAGTEISIHTSAREVTFRTELFSIIFRFQSTLPQGKWLQYFTKTSVYFYEISINIFEFTFVYYWNTLSIQKAHSNLFIFTGASLPVILCMLDTRTCKL